MKEEDIAIDPTNLDEELMRQPVLYYRACQTSEDLLRSKNEAKIDLDDVEAQTYIRVTKAPEEFGLTKTTEGAIKAAITRDPYVVKAKKLHSRLSEQHSHSQHILMAVEMRKKALENLTSLWLGQYFSTPNTDRVLKEGKRINVTDNAIKKTESKQRKGIEKDLKNVIEEEETKKTIEPAALATTTTTTRRRKRK